jgi:CubicO group peptidase (beta-lactamase class C family)
MLLVEDGLLGLNRPVAEYIPEFVGAGKHAVMVHHLLTHTAGLRNEEVEAHAVAQGAIPFPFLPSSDRLAPVAEYLCARYGAPLWKPPGVEMSYCTYGYDLLGEIVARVSGQSFAAFARDRILGPLGMADTHLIVPDTVRPRIVHRPADAPYAAVLNSRGLQDEPYPSCSAFSTALDMAIFGQLFLNRGRYGAVRLLSPATVAEMTADQLPGISARWGEEVFAEAGWGYGWEVHGTKKPVRDGSLRSAASIGHDGGGGTVLWVDPVYELVGVYVSVVLQHTAILPDWCADLFINMVTAAVTDI